MSHSFKSLLSEPGELLANLERRAGQVLSLTNKVQRALEGAERQHVLAAVYHEDQLVITVDSAAWAAQIRFAQDELRKQLVAQGEPIFTSLKVRVSHPG